MKKLLVVLLGLIMSAVVAFGSEYEIEKNIKIEFFITYPEALETYNSEFLKCVKENSMPISYRLLGLQLREIDEDVTLNVKTANKTKEMVREMFRYHVENNGVMDKYIGLENKEALIQEGYNLYKGGDFVALHNLLVTNQMKQEIEIGVCATKYDRFKQNKNPFNYEGEFGKKWKKFKNDWKRKELEKLED